MRASRPTGLAWASAGVPSKKAAAAIHARDRSDGLLASATTSMKYHVNIKIETALELLGQDKNPFSSTPLEAFCAMMDALNGGKTHYTGCDRMDPLGKCMGHDD